MGRFAERFRLVVGMWIFVGFGGSLLVAAFGIMAVTGSGVFQDKGEFSVDSEFAPGRGGADQHGAARRVHGARLPGDG